MSSRRAASLAVAAAVAAAVTGHAIAATDEDFGLVVMAGGALFGNTSPENRTVAVAAAHRPGSAPADAAEDEFEMVILAGGLVIEDDDASGGGLVIEDEGGGGLVIEDDGGGLVIEDDGGGLVIEDEGDGGLVVEGDGDGLVIDSEEDAGGLVVESTDDDAIVFEDSSALSFGLEDVHVEVGAFVDSDSQAKLSQHVSAELVAEYRPRSSGDTSVQGRAGLRFDTDGQYGDIDNTDTTLDYGDTWLRVRKGDMRFTLGAQTVMWARVDETAPQDRLSVQDITRYALDPVEDRRRSVPAFRFEYQPNEWKADFLFVPFFRAAELPSTDSVWFPVSKSRGRILGVDGRSQPGFAELVSRASVGGFDDYEQFGGAGLRLTYSGSGFDAGVSFQRARQSLPYYQFNPDVLAALSQPPPPGVTLTPSQALDFALAAGGDRPTLIEVHPLGTVIGADLSFVWQNATWRAEATWSDDVPITRENLTLGFARAVDWAAAVEFYPGDADTRINVQLVGRHLLGADDALDDTDTLSVNGEIEVPFDQNRWALKSRFHVGLDRKDIYVNPQLSYKGFEPHELYVGAHLFHGSEATPNGFFGDEDLVVFGLRTTF